MSYHLDYETFGTIDLKEVGAARYAMHPDTEILMASIRYNNDGPYLWVNPRYRDVLPSHPKAEHMMRAMAASEEDINAWNAPFEWFITKHCWKRSGCPGLRPDMERFRCVAAMSRSAGLPSALETASTLCLPDDVQKDPEGQRLIKRFCIPNKNGHRVMPEDYPGDFKKFGRYCLRDNDAETAMYHKLAPFKFKGAMLDAWKFDLALNDNGFPVNRSALQHALTLVQEASVELIARFRKKTGLNPSQRAAVKVWLAANGLKMTDMKANTVQEVLDAKPKDEWSKAMWVLYYYSEIQYSAIAKIRVMLKCSDKEGWARGMHLFYGAGTGRWAGKLIQPQNFRKSTIGSTEVAYRMICQGCTLNQLRLIFGNPLEVIASCIRNFIEWMDGTLLDADYSAIEARIVNWLAGQEDALERFRRNEDSYIVMASVIYGKPKEKITKDEREVGKRAVLGCGFSMAWEKFKRSCWEQYRILVSADLAKRAVAGYRKLHPKVQQLWYAVDHAAKAAIAKPGTVFQAGPILKLWVHTYEGIPYLLMRLPSGRKLAYPWPALTYNKSTERTEITFMGAVKGKLWGRCKTYGGKLVENATQGTAFDIMAYGGCNAMQDGFQIITLIHDQAPALHKPGQKLSDYVAALTRLPEWAEGLPIKAEGKEIPYYRK